MKNTCDRLGYNETLINNINNILYVDKFVPSRRSSGKRKNWLFSYNNYLLNIYKDINTMDKIKKERYKSLDKIRTKCGYKCIIYQIIDNYYI